MINTQKKTDNFYIYGIQPVKEVLRSDHPINSMTLANELEPRLKIQLSTTAKSKQIRVNYLPKQHIQRLTGPVQHQGVAVELKKYRYCTENFILKSIVSTKACTILILDQIQDPHNLGAIIRTAEITGVKAIVLPEKSSANINATVAKTSSGAVFHIPIHQTDDLFSFADLLKEKQVQIMAMVAGQKNNIFKTKFSQRLAIIVGSEGKGVRSNLLKYADLKISIPQFGRVNSLNASVSAAIVLYEIVRQQNFST